MSVFSSVRGNRVGRSVFNLSHVKRFTCDMGELIPALVLECVPGDTFKIGADVVTRFQPLVAPILDSVDLTVHYFFVPSRLLMDKEEYWNTFLTGGVDGKDVSVGLPLFDFANFYDGKYDGESLPFSNGISQGKYSLWDYFGLPILPNDPNGTKITAVRNVNHIHGLVQRAYNLIWNEYYRDENLVDEVGKGNATILYRSWKKDYFTSSLPWQQRGVSPALPLSGTIPVDNLLNSSFMLGTEGNRVDFMVTDDDSQYTNFFTDANGTVKVNSAQANATVWGVRGKLSSNSPSTPPSVNLQNATTFDVAVLREAFQIQRWLELNARGGVRYTEFLKAHFGIAPRDEVLQRPQYIGGTKSSIVVSEVLQTSQTTKGDNGSPQGSLAGHGLGAMSNYVCSYTAKEFGYIIGIASWMPKPSYQQGVNRMFSRSTKYDFYFPEFAHLSEQAVTKGEVYATGDEEHDNAIFGYQSCYSEMRYMPSFNCADMRDTFSYWHLGRIFSSDPSLNAGFLTTNPKFSGGIRKDIFADQNSKGLLVQFGNVVKAIRPLPVYGTPGFIDHVGRL